MSERTMNNKSNGKKMKCGVASISLLHRAIALVVLCAQIQVLVKQFFWGGGSENEIIPKTFALSQMSLSTTQEPCHTGTTRKESIFRLKMDNQTPMFTLGQRRHSPVSLHAAKSSIPAINNAESNLEKGSKRANVQVRSIMSILEERYDVTGLSANNTNSKEKTAEWKKTRNYLYQASRSYKDRSDDDTGDTTNVRTLSQQVISVLDFLDERLKLPPHISKRILQESPRILRKPVDSFLIPTADFLLQLWGEDLFLEAVERNPSLLLTSGVGYTTNRKKKTTATGMGSTSIRFDNDDNQNQNDNQSNRRIDETVEEILLKRTGLSSRAVERMKSSTPLIFGLSPSKVHSVVDFLDSILQEKEVIATTTRTAQTTKATETQTKISEEAEAKAKKVLGKLIVAYPSLFNLSVESSLKPRVEFLAKSCDLSPEQLAKLVQTSNGSVLGLSVEKNLQPTMEFLLKEIFCEDKNDKDDPRTMLTKCILRHPQLLGLSIANMKSKVNYFRTIGPFLASRIAKRCPTIYSLNLEQNIVPTIEFLAKVWGMNCPAGLSKEDNTNNDEFNALLYEYPNIITLSVVANLQPTMMFFNKTGYTVLNENWELSLSKNASSISESTNFDDKHPTSSRIRGRYIAASLYNRLLPRWHFCLSHNTEKKGSAVPETETETETSSVTGALPMPPASTSASIPCTPSLHILVKTDDNAFCEAMGFELDTFLNFKEEAIPRLKFSSQFDTWLKTGKPIDL